ncbi:ferredoxin [Anopheles sinensis]|uniref:Ferredoxin n=1 Tax=Anopheles sinensis TaxID=74873 RepID=A0A084W4S5_ANOSI|nr:ferredoxin [Anopheles sinensis]
MGWNGMFRRWERWHVQETTTVQQPESPERTTERLKSQESANPPVGHSCKGWEGCGKTTKLTNKDQDTARDASASSPEEKMCLEKLGAAQ